MRRYLLLLAVMTLAVGLLALPAGGAERITPGGEAASPSAAAMTNETPSAWFVELASLPAVKGTSKATLAFERRSFERFAEMAGLQYQIRRSFNTLFNGFSVNLNPSQLGLLTQLPGVKAVYPVLEVPMPEEPISSPDLATAIQMTGADIAQNELGLTGAGVKVAVMDTGIDYDHPDLGGCFGPGCRVAFGYDLVGDAYNADPTSPSYDPVPNPDPYPDDCQGHGTHVAGIVGANGQVVGVAPEVTFGAYRVFGCEGSTDTDIMISAMELALADGMDVLNMSIGTPYAWPEYPTAVASDYLVDAGMVVVASIGNEGATGTYSAGSPGVGDKVIGVASFDNTMATFPVFEVDDNQIGYNPMEYSAAVPTTGTEPIVYIGTACNGDTLEGDPTGAVALIERGGCTFAEKAANGYAAHATAVVIHNSAPGNFNGTLGAPPASPEIVVSISQEDGLYIRGMSDPMLTWTDQTAAFPNPTGGLISSFSSWGLTPDLTLKPDIGAPGGSIYSTIPLEQGGYGTKSGTSMASPHVAGAVALLLQAKPDTPAAQVRDILQNSADPHEWSLAPGYGYLEPVHRQGAGMLDIDDAILQDTVVSPGKLSLGESEAGPYTAKLRISNNGDSDVTYELSTDSLFGCCSAGIATTGTFPAELDYWLSGEQVTFSRSEIMIKAGHHKDVFVTIYPEPTDPAYGYDNVQYGGWITITPDDGSGLLRVPYAGFLGDYQSLEVLTPGDYGFPFLGWSPDGVNFGVSTGGDTFTMQGADIPYALVHLHHQARELQVEIWDATTGTPVHPVFSSGLEEEYLPRNSGTGGFYAFPWDGTRLQSNGVAKVKTEFVPDGEYYFVVKALKALGDATNPDDWETWTSPSFFVDRP